jgi:RNA polymerase sigma-70 factor, ECF subfamily
LSDYATEITDVYVGYFRQVYGYCVYRLFLKDLAEDATSDVFLRLVEKYPSLRGKGSQEIRNWLYGTANNVVAGYFRDSQRRKKIAAELARQRRGGVTKSSLDQERLDWPVLYAAIGKLKQQHQEIITLRYFQGLEAAEIAQILGKKYSTVRVQLTRAVKKLRQELEKHFGGSYEEK